MNRQQQWIAAGALLVIGLAVRLIALDVPPMDFHPTRQYRSALIARAASEAALAPLSPVERGNAVAMAQAQADIEPELMEPIAAALYDMVGREDLRLPRAFAALGWLLGALAVWLLVRDSDTTGTAGLSALGLMLLTPYTIDSSRAFMPDPWMVGLTSATFVATISYDRRPWIGTLAVRVVVAAAAGYVKPMALLLIAPAWLLSDVRRDGVVRGVLLAAFATGLAAAPAAWYYVALLNSGNPVATDRFFPELWQRATYWSGWWTMVVRVVGVVPLLIALYGLVAGRGPVARLLLGAWIGYLGLGLAFTHHISTHDYYSLPLIPLVAASAALGLSALARVGGPRVAWGAMAVVAGAFVVSPGYGGIYGNTDRARTMAADYERIGELTGHSPRVVSLDGSYGFPLAYHARISTIQLTLSIDRAVSELAGRTSGALLNQIRAVNGLYFAGTLQPELDADPLAARWLHERFRLVDRGGSPEAWRYVLFDLMTPAGEAAPPTPPANATPPIGSLDAPPLGVPITLGSDIVLLQGWALDDAELAGVEIIARTSAGDRFLARATRGGRRPDVAAAFPTLPGQDQAVWTAMLFPDDRGLAPATLVVRAVDSRGAVTVIGERELR